MDEESRDTPDMNDQFSENSEASVLEIEYIGEKNASIRVTANIQSYSDITKAASTLWSAASELEKCEIAKSLQEICYEKSGFYFPIDTSSAKMERLLVTIAANYPNTVGMGLVCSELGMDKKTVSAYITSANNWTSQYLYIENDTNIRVTTAGLRTAVEKTKTQLS